jgi:hypothetical protein
MLVESNPSFFLNNFKKNPEVEKAVFISLYDPVCQTNIKQVTTLIMAKQKKLITNIDTPNYSLWAKYCREVFNDFQYRDYSLNLKYKFLCYNRKPYPHRVSLVRAIHEKNLNSKGVVTLGPKYKETEMDHDFYVEQKFNTGIRNPDASSCRQAVPNDISSLGNMDIWNSSFLNVVTETTTQEFWLSEKTFKPIIGKRPFIVLGLGQMEKLKEFGFMTFSKYWDESLPVIDIIEYVSQLSFHDIRLMYRDMKPILEHNNNWFFNEYTSYNDNVLKTLVAMPFQN